MADAVQVSESGVDFGDFLEDDLFQIEKVLSDYVQLGEGINKVEFILKSYYDGTSIVFVEAKSSIPRDSNKFFEEIKSKMIHSITVWFSAVAGRHSKLQDHLPKNHKNLNILKLPIKLILVIPKVPKQYLSQFSNKFKNYVEVERKIWNIDYAHIVVLNEEEAKKWKLIDNFLP